jgi:RNA polymerase sigma-70 factor (ECF subfamily)
MLPPSDAELTRRWIQQRDAAALEALMSRYEGPLFRLLYGILRDHHTAEDVLQETFVQAMRQLDGVRPEGVRGWLFTVAYQQAMLWKRRQHRWPAGLTDSASETVPAPQAPPEIALEQAEELAWVRLAIQQLPTDQQTTLRARYYEGKKFREIAAAAGCPLNTALARLHAGLKKLRQLWERRYGQ